MGGHSPQKEFPETGARWRPRARKHDELPVGHLPHAWRSRRPTAPLPFLVKVWHCSATSEAQLSERSVNHDLR